MDEIKKIDENIETAGVEQAEVKTEPKETRYESRHDQPYKKPYNKDDISGLKDQVRLPRFKKKVCKFCYSKDIVIDYKKQDLLERFLTERGKILPRRITGTCAKHQRKLAIAIKQARMIALLPFVEK